MSDKYTAEQARGALDSLDDCARMSVGVDASGPRKVLEAFIEQAAQMMREREVGGAVAEIYEYRREHNVVNSPMLTGIRFTGMPLPVGTKLYTAPRAAVPDGWKLVPINQTPEMQRAGSAEWKHQSIFRIWDAILAAAPEVTNTWTYEKPTERGWYWYTENGNVTHHFVSQRPGHTYLCIEVEPHGFSMKRDFRPVERMHGQWMKMQQPAAPEVTK